MNGQRIVYVVSLFKIHLNNYKRKGYFYVD